MKESGRPYGVSSAHFLHRRVQEYRAAHGDAVFVMQKVIIGLFVVMLPLCQQRTVPEQLCRESLELVSLQIRLLGPYKVLVEPESLLHLKQYPFD